MNRLPLLAVYLLGALYVLSPIDVIPDVIPVLGWLDDVGVLGYVGYRFLRDPNSLPAPAGDQTA